jgi:hypothetical protein
MVGVEFVLLRLEKFLTVCKRRKTLFYATDTKLVTRYCSWKIEEMKFISNKEFSTLLQKSSEV